MPNVEEQERLTLGDHLRILRKNWLLILVATVLGRTVGTGVFPLLQTVQYHYFTQPYVSVRSANNDGALSALTQGGTCARQHMLSYANIVETASVLGDVIDDLDLDMSVDELRSAVTASSPTTSGLIDIGVTRQDPELTADIANAVGRSFTDIVTTVMENLRAGGFSPAQISTVEEATTPSGPVSPNTTRNVALGFMLGLRMAGLWAVLRTRVRSPKDLHQNSDLSTLGTIIDDPKASSDSLVVHTNLSSPRAESSRSLRTNPPFVNVDGEIGSLLAVMVILEDVVHCWGKDELFILPPGRIPLNPSELLGSREMQHLLAKLSEHFDYVIIINSPPILAVTDDAVLSSFVGGTILVAAIGIAQKKRGGRRTRSPRRHRQLQKLVRKPAMNVLTDQVIPVVAGKLGIRSQR